MAQRCKNRPFVGKELRFFTVVFFLDLVLHTPLLKPVDIIFGERTNFTPELGTSIMPAIFNPIFAENLVFYGLQQVAASTPGHRQFVQIHFTH
jgi:hypothetical protein